MSPPSFLPQDVIGLSVFNYDFGSITNESPIIKAVYNTLQEAEHRSTFYVPYWCAFRGGGGSSKSLFVPTALPRCWR